MAQDDVEEVIGLDPSVLIWLLIIPILLYIVLNVVGTVYYFKLKDRQVSDGVKGFSLATVIIGWLGPAFLNLTSPIVYAASPAK